MTANHNNSTASLHHRQLFMPSNYLIAANNNNRASLHHYRTQLPSTHRTQPTSPLSIRILANPCWLATCRRPRLLPSRTVSTWTLQLSSPSLPSKSPRIMDLVHSITLINNFTISATQILGLDNAIADSLSRFQIDRFRALAPTASLTPCVIPPLAMLI